MEKILIESGHGNARATRSYADARKTSGWHIRSTKEEYQFEAS
jgi:hypothetical protein